VEAVEIAVVGAGVVGLAVARALAQQGHEVVVLEAERGVGTHTSSRNSEVVHAGIYYTPGSLKARLCQEGRRKLFDYAASSGVELRFPGKLVVATDESELPILEEYRQKGLRNGATELSMLTAREAHALEPEVRCVGALWSPRTGIVDSHGLMAALRRDAQAAGAVLALNARVLGGATGAGGTVLRVGGEAEYELRCQVAVNSAGLWAQAVAASIQGAPAPPPSLFAIGHYFLLAGRSPFHHLVYPVAVQGGLGVHVTLDLAGQTRFGPDVEWINSVDYSFDESRAPAFEKAIRRYWPGLPDGALRPGYTGIRPKLSKGGQDFVIERSAPGLLNLFGIESPGLTAALAIGDAVVRLLAGEMA
jgi:L-2-hydroxyglutarate oxidase LhgO